MNEDCFLRRSLFFCLFAIQPLFGCGGHGAALGNRLDKSCCEVMTARLRNRVKVRAQAPAPRT